MSTCLPTLSRLCHRLLGAPKTADTTDAPDAPPSPKTHTYSTPSGVPLKVNVHLPTRHPGWPCPTVIFFHGGGLLYGDRGFILRGLCDDCVSRGWAFLAYDYRKLLPCSGHDILKDLHAAFTHYHTVLVPTHNLSSTNVFVAGYSAGGYLAQLAASHWEPKPLGLFLVAAQGGKLLSSHHYGLKNVPKSPATDPPTEEVQTYLSGETRTIGALPQSDASQSAEFWARMRVAQEVWKRGLYLDILTGVPGLGARLREAEDDGTRELLVPEDSRCLFPELLIDETFPPAFVVHGDKDATVMLEESEALVAQLKSRYVPAELVVIEGCAHQTMVYDMIYRNYMSGVMPFLEARMVADEGEEEVVGDEDEEDT